MGTQTSLPISLGSIAAGSLGSVTLTYPGSVGKKGAKAGVVVSGSYTPSGGTKSVSFNLSLSVILP